jgi:hypothetical protein
VGRGWDENTEGGVTGRSGQLGPPRFARTNNMAIRKRCKSKGCKASPKCEHGWWFDVQHQGRRYRMPVDDFAIARMKEGERRPVQSKQEAREWERLFIGEIKAGRDPKLPPHTPQSDIVTVADLLDRYRKEYVDAERLRSAATIHGRLKTLNQHLGALPVAALERADEIQAFKRTYRDKRTVATVNRVFSTLRAAIHWGMGQNPPVLKASPFHKFGVTIRVRDEVKRDRRISDAEERLLFEACDQMTGPEHKAVGEAMRDRSSARSRPVVASRSC